MVDIFQKNNASYIKMVDGVHLIGWDGYFKFKKKRIKCTSLKRISNLCDSSFKVSAA